jgi:hypothetical protein
MWSPIRSASWEAHFRLSRMPMTTPSGSSIRMVCGRLAEQSRFAIFSVTTSSTVGFLTKSTDPMAPPPQGWGCGAKGNDWLVPNIYPNACRRHDVCYEDQCGKWTCDKQFLRDMRAEGTGGPFSRWTYFGAVGLFGGSAYQDAGASRPPLVSPPPQLPRNRPETLS